MQDGVSRREVANPRCKKNAPSRPFARDRGRKNGAITAKLRKQTRRNETSARQSNLPLDGMSRHQRMSLMLNTGSLGARPLLVQAYASTASSNLSERSYPRDLVVADERVAARDRRSNTYVRASALTPIHIWDRVSHWRIVPLPGTVHLSAAITDRHPQSSFETDASDKGRPLSLDHRRLGSGLTLLFEPQKAAYVLRTYAWYGMAK